MHDVGSAARPQSTPWSKPVLLLIVTQIILGMREIPQSAFFLVYLQTAHLSPVHIATMTSTAQVTGMVAALAGGVLTARYGHKWAFLGGLLVTALNSVVFQLDHIWLISVLWALGGAGSAIANIGSSSYLTALGNPATMGTISAVFVLSTTIGGTIGNPLAGALIARTGYAVFGWVMLAVIAVMCVVVAWRFPHVDQSAVATQQAPVAPVWSLWQHHAVRLIVVMRACATMCYGMTLVLVPLILHALTHDVTLVANYTSLTLIAASLVQFLAGRAADMWGARLPTMIVFAIMVLCGVYLGVVAHTILTLMIVGVVIIACAWALSALMFVWIHDAVPVVHHPPLFGMLYAVWSISMIVGSITGSWLYEQWAGAPFVVFGLLNLVGCIGVWQLYVRPADSSTAHSLTHEESL